MLHLTLRQLKVFETVARHLSFSRAAKELFLSQPAVSMQIKQLEENVSLPLFEQMGKRIHLTEAGNELYHYSREILQRLTDLETALEELKGMDRGKLNIAVVTTANYFTPQLLAKFCQRHKNITVSLNVSNRESVLKQLDDNIIDLAIMGQPPEGLDVVSQSFMENPLVVVAPPDHSLCKKTKIPVKRLAQEVFLVREPGSGTRNAMERFFRQHSAQIRTGMETDTTEAIKQAVQAGMGLGIMSRHTAELELTIGRLKVLDVQGFPILGNWYVVIRKNKRLTATAQAFRDFLLSEAEDLMQKIKESATEQTIKTH